MSKNLFNRYIWIIDTIRRHGSITREELNRLWMRSSVSDGQPLPRRTFYNYRNAIEELFKINIECNSSTFEYFIDEGGDEHAESVTDWMLNTASLSNVLTDARDVASRVFLEDVPSARQFLSPVISAMKECKTIRFGYSPYSRTGAPRPVTLEPYFLKIFRLRWYVTGRNVKENVIKTYALDRMSHLSILGDVFEIPADFDPEAYFRDSFGIVFSHGKTHKVTLRVSPRQAKYFRALPLHHSQEEMIHDQYSIFNYRVRLTPDFVQEILSHGPNVTVLAPAELRAMVINNLQQSIQNYEN
ncbi:MAG: WYL domain-containing protein [Firmicutes bacterium]|nr:WYL domain-containing protein [Bacillota bacterium]MCM1401698.1 WYL domain-containing protein [Bacteroides sp.]MCM1477506.1 WYL domain-containing protein [Bacteroides sp.]